MRTLVAVLCASVGGAAWAQGTPDAGGGCGAVTAEGQCMGTTLSFCDTDTDQVVSYDCAVEYTPRSICMEIDPSYGYDCAVGVGEGCLFDDGAGGTEIAACQGMNPGCLETNTDAVCTENLGRCMETDEGTCSNGRLLVACQAHGQPYYLDCMDLGGTCQPMRCADVPEGRYCDDENAFCAAGLECADDFTCQRPGPDAGVAADSTVVGSDMGGAPPPRDAGGTTTPDAGFGFPDAKSGGGSGGTLGTTKSSSCSQTGGSAWAAVLLLALARRRYAAFRRSNS